MLDWGLTGLKKKHLTTGINHRSSLLVWHITQNDNAKQKCQREY